MKTYVLQILLLALVLCIEGNAPDEPIVKLSHGGDVLGSIMKSQKGKRIYAFRGIPYAEPPTGLLRFKPPVPKTPWQVAPHDATVDGPVCTQFDIITKDLIGQEDCLYLNVYTPELPDDDDNDDDDDDDEDDDDKRPVMVFIHGGGFSFGHAASAMYGPGRLLDGSIVLVSMNYRLGPLGFLSTNDDSSRGNYGLMDQSMALQWIQDNIEAFGGDASRVTIFGESAGGASVGYHLLSPLSSGLFHAAISQSGSPLCPWAFQDEPLYWTKKLAVEFNCSVDTSSGMVDCLRGVDVNDIMKKNSAFMTFTLFPMVFVPTVDGVFLTIEPREAITSGKIINKVPYITGVNQDEGIFVYAGLLRDHPSSDLTSKKDISEIMKYIIDPRGRSEAPSNLIEEKYLASVDMSDKESSRNAVIRIFSDFSFDIPHYETAKWLSHHGFQTYTYSLDYAPSVTFCNIFGLKERWGVGHADDLFLLFDGVIFGLMRPNEDDKRVIKILRTLWTNFATYGDPTPNITKLHPVDWEPSEPEKFQVFHINTHITKSVYDTSKEELYHFWTKKVRKVIEKTSKRGPKDEL